jgi:TonB family protein
VACAIYWFHPLVWIAWRQLELEAERACDDAVLARSEATAYADQLVAVARRLSAASNAPLLAMASRADLASRVNAVLDGGQRRGRAGRLCVAVATAAAAALVLTVSPLRMVAAPQAAGAVPEFRTETRLVVTAVTVSYPNGSAIHGLTASDFVVREDGVPQTVSFFDVRNGGGAEPPSDYYVLGYYPINTRADGQVRKIDISVKTATTAKVETRAGYYAMRRPDNPPSGAAKSLATGTTPPPPPNSRPPVLLFKKEPEYSEAARNAKYQGTVVLNVEVDDSGKVQDCRVTRSLGLGLDEKAIEAVQQWRFRPATKDGKPIAARTVVEVSFRLM